MRRAKWSGLNGTKILFGLLIAALPNEFLILVAVDETLERRQGKKIKALGAYRDAVRSSNANVVISFGLKWECMALIVPLPWCQRYWALPFLTLLAPSKKANEEAGVKHKASIEWTMKMVSVVSRWMLRKPSILLGDGAYACMDLAHHCLEKRATLISRFRLDAQLFEEPEYKPKKLGRKPIKGKRIQLRTLLNDVTQPWQCAKVKWYGGELKILEYLVIDCLWYQAGKKPLPVRIILIKTPDGEKEAEAIFSTCQNHSATQIIEWFVLRWDLEVTFEEMRTHLGIETQRQWSDLAIARSTPLLMALHSLQLIQAEITSWYDKNYELCFSDVLIAVRNALWREKHFSKSANNDELYQLSEQEVKQLIYQLSLTG